MAPIAYFGQRAVEIAVLKATFQPLKEKLNGKWTDEQIVSGVFVSCPKLMPICQEKVLPAQPKAAAQKSELSTTETAAKTAAAAKQKKLRRGPKTSSKEKAPSPGGNENDGEKRIRTVSWSDKSSSCGSIEELPSLNASSNNDEGVSAAPAAALPASKSFGTGLNPGAKAFVPMMSRQEGGVSPASLSLSPTRGSGHGRKPPAASVAGPSVSPPQPRFASLAATQPRRDLMEPLKIEIDMEPRKINLGVSAPPGLLMASQARGLLADTAAPCSILLPPPSPMMFDDVASTTDGMEEIVNRLRAVLVNSELHKEQSSGYVLPSQKCLN